jgi:histone deacetylase 6
LKETALSSKNCELEQTRIDFIKTRDRYKQAEEELNKQDQLGEGLHLIDFEQLKIENQALNEKRGEKNQELIKIEEKIKTNAHMLTHVKEKLAFARKRRLALCNAQQDLDGLYGECRTKLATVRTHRDAVRDENSSLKKSSGLIGMTELLYDFEHQSNELEMKQERVGALKTRYNDLIKMKRELEAKILQRQPLDPMLLRMNR